MLHVLYSLIVFPVEQVIELCYTFVFRVSGSFGLSILGVSAAVSTLVLPVYLMAEKQQRREREIQAQMRSEIGNIKAVFKGDKRHMLLAALYRQNRYHPLYSLRGSLDLFIQIPFFIAAYHFLHGLKALSGQSFLFINNLGAPDGILFGINILPVLMTIINCVSGAVYTRGFALKDKLQLYGMAAVFLLLLYHSPAGLVLYWTSNNVYNLIKNILQKTKHSGKIISAVVVFASVVLAVYVVFFHFGKLEKRLLVAAFSLLLGGVFQWKKSIFSAMGRLARRCAPAGFSLSTDIKTFALSSGILFLLIGLVIPSALISSSVEEFSHIDGYINPFSFIQNVLLQSAGIFFVWCFFLYILSDKKIKPLLLVSLAAPAMLSVINTFIFKEDNGAITNLLELSNIVNHDVKLFLISGAVNIVAALVVTALALSSRKFILHSLLSVTLVSCLVFGIVNAAKIYRTDNFAGKPGIQSAASPEPEYLFSRTGKNVLLVMLDRAFSGYVPAILEERPELRELFSGFVFYPNTVSFMGHTVMGAPPLYGGYEYTPLEMNKRNTVPLVDKHNEALLLLPKLFLDKGFTVMVTDPPLSNYSWIPDLKVFNNYPGIHAANVLYNQKYTGWWKRTRSLDSLLEKEAAMAVNFLRNDLIRFSFFRTVIPFLRKFLYDNGNYLEIQKESIIEQSALEAYAALDILPEITEITAENINAYNTVYNDLTHQPDFFQFPDYGITQKVSNRGTGAFSDEKYYYVNIASWLLLAKWFEYLKENGVYDNTRIIIVADHGLSENKLDSKIYAKSLPGGDYLNQYTPLLLFKDFSAGGTLRTDDTFMTNADVPLLALGGLVDNPVNPFTGNPLKADKSEGVTITTSHKWDPSRHRKFGFTIKKDEWLHVRDNIFDMDNWRLTLPPDSRR